MASKSEDKGSEEKGGARAVAATPPALLKVRSIARKASKLLIDEADTGSKLLFVDEDEDDDDFVVIAAAAAFAAAVVIGTCPAHASN